MIKKVSMFLSACFPLSLENIVARELSDCSTVADLGCGEGEFVRQVSSKVKNKCFFGYDCYFPYLQKAAKLGLYTNLKLCDMRQVKERFDAVMMIFTIEHIEKQSLIQFENMADNKIIIVTVRGFDHNDGFPGIESQEHKSGWEIEDFKREGYKVRGYCFRTKWFHASEMPLRPLFTAISLLMTVFTYYLPQFADHLICIKEKSLSKTVVGCGYYGEVAE